MLINFNEAGILRKDFMFILQLTTGLSCFKNGKINPILCTRRAVDGSSARGWSGWGKRFPRNPPDFCSPLRHSASRSPRKCARHRWWLHLAALRIWNCSHLKCVYSVNQRWLKSFWCNTTVLYNVMIPGLFRRRRQKGGRILLVVNWRAPAPIWVFPISVVGRSFWADIDLSWLLSGFYWTHLLSPGSVAAVSNASTCASKAAFLLLLEQWKWKW